MPRLDDPEIKLKQKKPFIRKSLRPWDDPEDFIPNKTFETTDEESALIKTSDHLSAVEKQITDKQLVNNRETIGNQLVNNRETIGNQLVNNRETIGNQLVNNKVNNKVNNADIVVSSYINTNYRNLDIPESWESIDITPLESIGFDLSHLVQINRAYEKTPNTTLSPELIQTSIYAFAYDLKNNNVEKIFKNPAATVLLSLLKKGQPYNSVTPDKCVSPQQDALNKHNHMLQTQHARELELMQQIKDTEFSLWLEAFPDDELFLLCPENAVPLKATDKLFKTVRKRMAKEKAKDYFDAEIWPTKKQAILATATRGTVTLSQEEKVLTNA